MKLTPDEEALLESVEKGEWETVPEFQEQRARYQVYAEATFRKDRRINIRISERDLAKLQQKALDEGLPYQTLVASILHKYVTGRLAEQAS